MTRRITGKGLIQRDKTTSFTRERRIGLNIFRYHWFYLNWGKAAQNCQGKPKWRFFRTLGMGAMSAWGYIFQRGFLELLVCWYHREGFHPTGQKLHFVTTHWLKTLQHPLHISVFWLSNVNYLRKQAKFNSLYKSMPTKGKLFDQKKNMCREPWTLQVYFVWSFPQKKMRSLARHRSLGGLV